MTEKIKPSRELLERIYGGVRGIGEQSKRRREVIAEVLGLNPTDLQGVDFLYSRDGACTAGELAQATGLTSGSATALIDRLERAGYARREADPQDRRRQIVRMQDKAIARCEEVYEPIQKDLFKLWSDYRPEQLKLVEDFVTRSVKLHAEGLERLRTQRPDSSREGRRPRAKHETRSRR